MTRNYVRETYCDGETRKPPDEMSTLRNFRIRETEKTPTIIVFRRNGGKKKKSLLDFVTAKNFVHVFGRELKRRFFKMFEGNRPRTDPDDGYKAFAASRTWRLPGENYRRTSLRSRSTIRTAFTALSSRESVSLIRTRANPVWLTYYYKRCFFFEDRR